MESISSGVLSGTAYFSRRDLVWLRALYHATHPSNVLPYLYTVLYLTRKARDGEGSDEEHRGPASEPLPHDAAQHAGRDHCQGRDARCARRMKRNHEWKMSHFQPGANVKL